MLFYTFAQDWNGEYRVYAGSAENKEAFHSKIDEYFFGDGKFLAWYGAHTKDELMLSLKELDTLMLEHRGDKSILYGLNANIKEEFSGKCWIPVNNTEEIGAQSVDEIGIFEIFSEEGVTALLRSASNVSLVFEEKKYLTVINGQSPGDFSIAHIGASSVDEAKDLLESVGLTSVLPIFDKDSGEALLSSLKALAEKHAGNFCTG